MDNSSLSATPGVPGKASTEETQRGSLLPCCSHGTSARCLLLSWHRLCWLTSWFTEAAALAAFRGASGACPPACPSPHVHKLLCPPSQRSGWAQPPDGEIRVFFARSQRCTALCPGAGVKMRTQMGAICRVNSLERIPCFCYTATAAGLFFPVMNTHSSLEPCTAQAKHQ